jgi:hypothetical protein
MEDINAMEASSVQAQQKKEQNQDDVDRSRGLHTTASMWGKAVLTATYLLNRSPTTATSNISRKMVWKLT